MAASGGAAVDPFGGHLQYSMPGAFGAQRGEAWSFALVKFAQQRGVVCHLLL